MPSWGHAILGHVNLHDWIDEVCDLLDIDLELDETLVLDLARDAAHGVARPAAPLTTYLLGFAAAHHELGEEELERLAGRVAALAEGWDQPADHRDAETEVEVDVPDDSGVDHTGDNY